MGGNRGWQPGYGGRGKSVRLLAWSWGPEKTGKRWSLVETFPCNEHCRSDSGEWRTRDREELRCTRFDLPQVKWRPVSDDLWSCHMGAQPDRNRDSPNWREPDEGFEDGCPGGWYRSRFAISLHEYIPITVGSATIIDPKLGSAPRFVREAVQLYLRERGRADGYFNRRASE